MTIKGYRHEIGTGRKNVDGNTERYTEMKAQTAWIEWKLNYSHIVTQKHSSLQRNTKSMTVLTR